MFHLSINQNGLRTVNYIEHTVKHAAQSAAIFRSDLKSIKATAFAQSSAIIFEHATQYFVKDAKTSAKVFASKQANTAQHSTNYIVEKQTRRQAIFTARKTFKVLYDDYGFAVMDLSKYVVKAALEVPAKVVKSATLDNAGGRLNMFVLELSKQWNVDSVLCDCENMSTVARQTSANVYDIQDLQSIAHIALLQSQNFTHALKAVQREIDKVKRMQPHTKYKQSQVSLDDESMLDIASTQDYFAALDAQSANKQTETNKHKASDLLTQLHLTEVQQKALLTVAACNGNKTQAAKILNKSQQAVSQNIAAITAKAEKYNVTMQRKVLPAIVYGRQAFEWYDMIETNAAHAKQNAIEWTAQHVIYCNVQIPIVDAMPVTLYNAMQHATQYFVKDAKTSAESFIAAFKVIESMQHATQYFVKDAKTSAESFIASQHETMQRLAALKARIVQYQKPVKRCVADVYNMMHDNKRIEWNTKRGRYEVTMQTK